MVDDDAKLLPSSTSASTTTTTTTTTTTGGGGGGGAMLWSLQWHKRGDVHVSYRQRRQIAVVVIIVVAVVVLDGFVVGGLKRHLALKTNVKHSTCTSWFSRLQLNFMHEVLVYSCMINRYRTRTHSRPLWLR